jgi:hypothetical protein
LWLGRHLLAFALLGIGAAFAFLLAYPWLLDATWSTGSAPEPSRRRWFVVLDRLHHGSLAVLMGVWIFALGSSIASFLNVVAYRLPRGQSILGRSRCPRCGHQLSFLENMPVFGWFRNGGRCQACRLPISTRYLWVEFILGTAFALLFWLGEGSANAIRVLQGGPAGVVRAAWWELAGFGLLATLASLALLTALVLRELRAARASAAPIAPTPKTSSSKTELTVRNDDQATLRSEGE